MADNSIALIQVPDSMKTIGSVLNFANSAQNLKTSQQEYQRSNIGLQREQQANEERLRLQEFTSNPDNFQTNGRIDLDKINGAVPKIAPYTGGEFIGKMSTLASAQTQAENAKLSFSQTQRGIVGGLYGVLGRAGVADPKVVAQELDNLKAQFPNDKSMAAYVDGAKVGLGNMQPGPNLAKSLVTQSQSLLSAPEQQSLNQTAGLTNTGGTLAETVTQPMVGGNPASISLTGRSAPLTLPPTTPTFDAATNTPGYVGKPAQGGPVQAGPALGQPENASGVAASGVADWNTVKGDAAKASQDIGVLQEIKKYAPGAAAGVVSDRRAFISGLAGLIGMDVGEMQKTETDLLAKNSNMLALAGGDTNLARSMAEVANPNIHMTKEAITKAANQVIGQRQLALARQQFLLPQINNPAGYAKAVTEFNANADPRILQLPSLSVAEKVEMKKAMSPAEQKAFAGKVRWMQQQGILR